DVADFAKRTRGVNLAGLLVQDGTHSLATHLQDAVVFLRSRNHGEPVVHGVGQRLLAVNVLASGAGIDHHSAMLMIGDRDDDGIDVLAVEDLFIVASCCNRLVHRFLAGGETAFPEIADGDALGARDAQRGFQQLASADPSADGSKAYRIAGLQLRGGCPESGGFEQRDFGGGTGGDSARSDAHELTASPGTIDHSVTSMKLTIKKVSNREKAAAEPRPSQMRCRINADEWPSSYSYRRR